MISPKLEPFKHVCQDGGMAKKSISKKKKKAKKVPTDINLLMHSLGERSTAQQVPAPADVTQEDIRRVMSALGARGGKKGGKRRMETMTQVERSAIAFKAARARWDKLPKAKP